MSTPYLQLQPGNVFAREYKIQRALDEGGMGAVYIAEQLSTGIPRALKVMHPTLVQDAKSRERFAQEARISSQIESDHVVQVVASGVDEATGLPWLAMELLRGETLAAMVQRRGALPVAEVIEVFRQLGHALGHAHAVGLVHRDVKPENVFLANPRREGVPFTVKLLDFGIAKIVADSRANLTGANPLGSPLWMAPEQGGGGSIRPGTDVYALGLMAFYLLTGKLYWRMANSPDAAPGGLLVEILTGARDPATVRAAQLGVAGMIPPAFDAWFARCLAQSVEQRFRDANEAVAALVEILTSVSAPHALLHGGTFSGGASAFGTPTAGGFAPGAAQMPPAGAYPGAGTYSGAAGYSSAAVPAGYANTGFAGHGSAPGAPVHGGSAGGFAPIAPPSGATPGGGSQGGGGIYIVPSAPGVATQGAGRTSSGQGSAVPSAPGASSMGRHGTIVSSDAFLPPSGAAWPGAPTGSSGGASAPGVWNPGSSAAAGAAAFQPSATNGRSATRRGTPSWVWGLVIVLLVGALAGGVVLVSRLTDHHDDSTSSVPAPGASTPGSTSAPGTMPSAPPPPTVPLAGSMPTAPATVPGYPGATLPTTVPGTLASVPGPGATIPTAPTVPPLAPTPPGTPHVLNVLSSPGGPIYENHTTYAIAILREDCTIANVALDLRGSHPSPSDLVLRLRPPSGDVVELQSRQAVPPFRMYALPQLAGGTTDGAWVVSVADNVPQNRGVLEGFTLSVTCQN